MYTLSVYFNDTQVKGSPYKIDLRKKRPVSIVEEVEQLLETVEKVLLHLCQTFLTLVGQQQRRRRRRSQQSWRLNQ